MTKAASLNIIGLKSPVTAQKGQAGVSPVSVQEIQAESVAESVVQVQKESPKLLATKSMTVKIDEVSYKKLKTHGLHLGKTSQDIFVEALAMYFKVHKI